MAQIPHLYNGIIMMVIHLIRLTRGLSELMHKQDLSQYLNMVLLSKRQLLLLPRVPWV